MTCVRKPEICPFTVQLSSPSTYMHFHHYDKKMCIPMYRFSTRKPDPTRLVKILFTMCEIVMNVKIKTRSF